MEKVLITGGAGFIGSQLGASLHRDGYDVCLVDNMSDGHEDNLIVDGKRFENFILDDVRDKNFGDKVKDVDTIFHFAATSSLPKCQANAVSAYDNNVSALANVLEAARLHGVRRVIFSSTSAVYENTTDSIFEESAIVSPDLIYSSTKYTGEQMCRAFASTYGLDIIVARFFNVYGEHQDIHRLIPPFVGYLAREVYFNRRPTLFNNTDAKRDYVNFKDVLNCLKLMMNSKDKFAGDVFNVCSGVGYSVPEIVKIYEAVAGKNIQPEYKDPSQFWDKFPELYAGRLPLKRERTKKEVYKNSIGSTEKAKKHFGFQAKVSLSEGLKSVHAYCESQFARSGNK